MKVFNDGNGGNDGNDDNDGSDGNDDNDGSDDNDDNDGNDDNDDNDGNDGKPNCTTLDISGVNARMFSGLGGFAIATGVNARATNAGDARQIGG